MRFGAYIKHPEGAFIELHAGRPSIKDTCNSNEVELKITFDCLAVIFVINRAHEHAPISIVLTSLESDCGLKRIYFTGAFHVIAQAFYPKHAIHLNSYTYKNIIFEDLRIEAFRDRNHGEFYQPVDDVMTEHDIRYIRNYILWIAIYILITVVAILVRLIKSGAAKH